MEEVSLGVGPAQEPSALLFLHDKLYFGEIAVQHESSDSSRDLLADAGVRVDWEQHALKSALRGEAGILIEV